MTGPNFQKRVAQFVAAHDLETGVEARLLDLISELGEVAKEVLKGSEYGRVPFHPTAEWEQELADAFFALICIANSTGVNLDTALDDVIMKYTTRLTSEGDAGSGR